MLCSRFLLQLTVFQRLFSYCSVCYFPQRKVSPFNFSFQVFAATMFIVSLYLVNRFVKRHSKMRIIKISSFCFLLTDNFELLRFLILNSSRSVLYRIFLKKLKKLAGMWSKGRLTIDLLLGRYLLLAVIFFAITYILDRRYPTQREASNKQTLGIYGL